MALVKGQAKYIFFHISVFTAQICLIDQVLSKHVVDRTNYYLISMYTIQALAKKQLSSYYKCVLYKYLDWQR